MSSMDRDDPLWDAELDELAWQLLLADPEPPASAPVPDPADADAVELTVPERIDLLVELQRQFSRLAALEADLLVSLVGVDPVHREVVVLDRDSDTERTIVLTDEMREELAVALHRSPGQVHDEVEIARLLAGPLQATRDALAAGDISARHARVIAEQAQRLEGHLDADAFADACTRLQQRVLADAVDLTVAQTRALARRTVEVIDRDAARRRREAARRDIGVQTWTVDDGLSIVQACLPTIDALRLHAAIDAHAHLGRADPTGHGSQPDGTATIGQRRATALLDLVLGGDGAQVTAEIGIVVDLATLLGLADQPAMAGPKLDEPVGLDDIRDLLLDTRTPVRLRRLVVDPLTGALLDRGRRSYPVTDAMRAFLIARDRTCRFPGCPRPATRCHIDHATAWEDGGRSDRCNFGPLCQRHHQLKTHGGWEITTSRADGSCTWTSPLGRTRDVPPHRLLPQPDPPVEPKPPTEPEPPPPF